MDKEFVIDLLSGKSMLLLKNGGGEGDVKDVQVNGSSVVTDGVAEIDLVPYVEYNGAVKNLNMDSFSIVNVETLAVNEIKKNSALAVAYKDARTPEDDTDAANKKYVDDNTGNKVDKVEGKGLSTNDYTDADKTRVAGAALKFKIDAHNVFDVLNVEAYAYSDGTTIELRHLGLIFDFDDWCEYASYDESINTVYRTLIQWDFNASDGLYYLNLYKAYTAIPIAIASWDGANYTWLEAEGVIDLGYKLGFKIGGKMTANWYSSLTAEGSDDLFIDLEYLYGILKATNNSINDSIDDLYKAIETANGKLAGIAPGAEVNVQADWSQTDDTQDDYIKNKPSDLVADANYTHTDNNYTETERIKLAGIADGAEVNVQADWSQQTTTADDYIKNKPTIPTATSDLTNDSDFVADAAYTHTDNNYTSAERTKLAGIAAGAEVNVQADWGQETTTADDYIKNKPAIPTATSQLTNDAGFVADAAYTHTDNNYTSAERTKLAGIAAGAEVNVQADWGLETATADDYIKNKPAIPTATSDLTNDSDFVADANYTHTDNNYTSAERTKLAGIAAGAEVNVQADWSQQTTAADDYIKNKPAIPTATSDLTNDSDFVADAAYTHTDNNYTTAEKNKLAGLEPSTYKGTFGTSAELLAAYPNPVIGWSADVNIGDSQNPEWHKYICETNGVWTDGGTMGGETPESIKVKYESNDDTNAYTDNEKNKLAGIAAGAEVNVQSDWSQETTTADDYIKNKPTIPTATSQLTNDAGFVADDKYTHTDNNYTSAERTKLAGIAAGAEVNVQADWSQQTAAADDYIKNKPTIPTATSQLTNDAGFVADASYTHTDNNYTSAEKTKLAGIAAGAEVNVQADWSQQTTAADDYIKNKPTIPTATSQLTNDSHFVSDTSYNHTDNNYTTAEKNKLAGIAAGAEVNVQSDWNQQTTTADDYIKNKPGAVSKSSDGLMTAALYTKLGGIQEYAEVNPVLITSIVFNSATVSLATQVTIYTSKAANVSVKTADGKVISGTMSGKNPYTFTPADVSIFAGDFIIEIDQKV
ncbi:MAG: hypothetical protein LBF90_03305 [Prevotellaceae bacterium]|jgi:hypothetical protein|nr:hypothetical protein [Prevotellaceae bacterium]